MCILLLDNRDPYFGPMTLVLTQHDAWVLGRRGMSFGLSRVYRGSAMILVSNGQLHQFSLT